MHEKTFFIHSICSTNVILIYTLLEYKQQQQQQLGKSNFNWTHDMEQHQQVTWIQIRNERMSKRTIGQSELNAANAIKSETDKQIERNGLVFNGNAIFRYMRVDFVNLFDCCLHIFQFAFDCIPI